VLKPSQQYAQLVPATDPEVMKAVLQTELSRVWNHEVHIQKLLIPRVLPGKNGRLLIQYCFSVSHNASVKDWVFFGHLRGPEEAVPALAQNSEVIFLPQFRLLVPVFPFDPGLKPLQRFVDGEGLSDLLADLSEGGVTNGALHIGKVQVLGYRPERRALLRVQICTKDRSDYVIVKIARPEMAESYFSVLQALEHLGFHAQAPDQITIPHPVGCSSDGVLWMEWVPDPSLHDLVASPNFPSACLASACALHKLHSAQLPGLPVYTVDEEKGLLRRLVAHITAVYPQMGKQLEDAFLLVEQSTPDAGPDRPVPIHRDFYDKQTLVGPQRTTLLDIDTLSSGDPALDLGNFLAHFAIRANQMPSRAEGIMAGRRVFIQGYQTSDESLWNRVKWWKATALLRLVCIYGLRPAWQNMAIGVLAQYPTISGLQAVTR
jgi:aminoglycoside phosphotransferase (APT) family kinase protein